MSILKLTVIEFNEILADVIHNQLQLNQLCISGEISQLNYYNEKKHLYFTLSQENAHLQCVIYNQHLKKIPLIKKGDQCNVFGACKYLKNKGQLIFSCVNISLDGEGKRNHRLTKQIETFRKKGFLSKKTDKEIEAMITKLDDQNLDFEKQVEVYGKTLKKFHSLTQKIHQLDTVIEETKQLENDI